MDYLVLSFQKLGYKVAGFILLFFAFLCNLGLFFFGKPNYIVFIPLLVIFLALAIPCFLSERRDLEIYNSYLYALEISGFKETKGLNPIVFTYPNGKAKCIKLDGKYFYTNDLDKILNEGKTVNMSRLTLTRYVYICNINSQAEKDFIVIHNISPSAKKDTVHVFVQSKGEVKNV